MHPAVLFRSTLGLALCLVALQPSGAAEPWADQRLNVTADLRLWLDASVQKSAVQASAPGADPVPEDGEGLATFFDGSGNAAHVTQSADDFQPLFRTLDLHTLLRFDGRDDRLLAAPGERELKEFSLFVFAAPASNFGGFRSLLSARAPDANDYQTGLNVDLGFGATTALQVINVEGAGMAGQRNLLEGDPLAFRRFHTIELRSRGRLVELFVDGQKAGQRERQADAAPYRFDELAIGCRLIAGQGVPMGPFHGDIAEVLLYDRILSDDETSRVRTYLSEKYAGIDEAVSRLGGDGGRLLELVEDPPAVQMLVPGFEVYELPVKLSNINNVLYRSDGTLVALAYDGNVYLLRDRDGDRIEETPEQFWENDGRLTGSIGMALTPDGYPHGRGLFVTSKGKCSLIVDTDGDDRADKEIVVAQGWPQLPHGVDALGVAVDPADHSVCFGLGTANFTDAYLLKDTGEAKYRPENERGTILRVAPDLKSREIVCTGIRFPVALRFNAEGELFCTDQEGATWLPNGNPYDELLHIQPGRHYGFPPQHPRWLPDVIDEPSLFDYKPQHQSTCGLNFNEPVSANSPIFGPEHWRHDALITGYSRGKLYRTRLTGTDAGYVAQTQLIGSASMLPVDACVSPEGDLVLSVHSGGPDWGSGPAGEGKLYKIRYQHPDLPVPVLTWAQSRHQVRVAFDRPLTPDQLSGLSAGISIEHGEAVRAGDRFEKNRPGYAVVQQQMATPRFDLPVSGVQVTPDWRTLIIDTARHNAADHHYAMTIEGLGRPDGGTDAALSAEDGALPQHPQTDLNYALHGVTAVLETGGETLWEGWLPHLSTGVSAELTSGSADHDLFRARLAEADALTISTQADLRRMLQPDVQPGSQLDFEYPAETVSVLIQSPSPLSVEVGTDGSSDVDIAKDEKGQTTARITIRNDETDLLPLRIRVERGAAEGDLSLDAVWYTAQDDRRRPFPLSRFLLPWVSRSTPESAPPQAQASLPLELEGGSWGRGRKVFFSQQAGCATCHTVHGEGGRIGPDLSNLRHRDYHSVHRDIVRPSFAINPDHLAYTVVLTDGRVLTGLVWQEEGRTVIGTGKGELHRCAPGDIEEMAPSRVSIMPDGIDKVLGTDGMRDLLTYLIGPPPRMPEDRPGSPPPRSRAEVERVLAGGETQQPPLRPLHIVLVAGAKDHGPGEHDYPAWQRVWTELFRAADDVTVSTAMDFPDAALLEAADLLVFYQKGDWTPERAAALDAFLARGGGVSYIHYAVDGGRDADGFARRIGLAWQGGLSKFRHGPLEMIFAPEHPIARNLDRLSLEDESYWNLRGERGVASIVAEGSEEGALQPLIWCREQRGGRVFVSIPGHYSWSFDDPLFRIILLRGIAWTAGESVDRFNPLVRMGAVLSDQGT